ncbi:MAG: C39 family peptidase [Mycobacterium sp.]|uniref:C39 family peptidase n=1 Tax=Mycobacterium sp. TaxID=1785 RepID=UPI0026243F0F|nr:C39 family peptidase [Mycobacterium sp.]MDI3314718.1 C39 family peptidase [Mycobacterium sp.]
MVTGIATRNRTAGVGALVVAAAIASAAAGIGVSRADPDGQMYGNPEAAAPYWRYQHQQDCGLMAVADVVGQLTGREPSQIGIELRGIFSKSVAHRGDIYFFDGSAPQDLVVLLQKYGIQSSLTEGNTMQTVERDLAGGHKLIAGVNAETLWDYPPGKGQRTRADHAVVITGVDTRDNVVHLNDSGTPNGRDERIPMATFTQAWATSNDLLIVTRETNDI